VAKDVPPPSTNLADSISEAAQLFAHEEITREESTEAYQAFQSSGASHTSKNDDYVPGGLDAPKDDPEVLADAEPIGISMFESMFEYLLSQFTFSAKDIRITVIHPDRSSFRFKVSELHYGRPTSGPGESTRTINISGVEIAHRDLSTSESPASGHSPTHSLPSAPYEFNAPSHRVHNVSLSPTITIPSSPPPSSPEVRSGSNESVPPGGSSPPEDRSRPSSASGSTNSSIFHSVLTSQGSKLESGTREATVTHSQDAGADDMEQNQSGDTAGECSLSQADEAMEDGLFHQVFFSLATEPIVIHITTSALPPVQTQSAPYSSESDTPEPDSRQPNLEVSVSVGIVACALTAAQISSILDVVSTIGSHSYPSTAPTASKGAGIVVPPLSLLDQAALTMQIRGLVLLLQSVPAPFSSSSRDVPFADFFAHPLTPPKTNHGYIRCLIDGIRADLSVSTTLGQLTDEHTPGPDHMQERSRPPRVVRGTTSSHIKFSVGDLTAFAFCMDSNATTSHAARQAFVLPIILTDPHLFIQYHPEHHFRSNMGHYDVSPDFLRKAVPTLPEFGIMDWTLESNRTSQAKPSLWRVRPPPGYRRSQKSHAGDPPIIPPIASSPKSISGETSASKPQSALSGQVLLSSSKDPGTGATPGSTCSIHIDVTPLHVFVDMGGISTALDFLEISSVLRSRSSSSEPEIENHGSARGHDNSGDPTPPSSPHRKTLQQIREPELEDLNLSVDYLSKESAARGSSRKSRKNYGHSEVFNGFLFSILFAKLNEQDQSHRDDRTEFDINFAMVRVQIRCPSPPSLLQRSGASILDIHSLRLTSRSPLGAGVKYPNRFGVKTDLESTSGGSNSRNNHVLTAEWRTLLLACSSAGAETARGFCSIGPLSSAADNEVQVSTSHDHTHFQENALPFVKLSQNSPVSSGRNSGRSAAVIVEIEIPTIILNLSKPNFDSLQFWIDDVSQLLEPTTAASGEASQENSSRNPSLVGSRFFSASKQGSVEIAADEPPTGHIKPSIENIVKLTISEGQKFLILLSLLSH
jgi:autophagy-related protein 2